MVFAPPCSSAASSVALRQRSNGASVVRSVSGLYTLHASLSIRSGDNAALEANIPELVVPTPAALPKCHIPAAPHSIWRARSRPLRVDCTCQNEHFARCAACRFCHGGRKAHAPQSDLVDPLAAPPRRPRASYALREQRVDTTRDGEGAARRPQIARVAKLPYAAGAARPHHTLGPIILISLVQGLVSLVQVRWAAVHLLIRLQLVDTQKRARRGTRGTIQKQPPSGVALILLGELDARLLRAGITNHTVASSLGTARPFIVVVIKVIPLRVVDTGAGSKACVRCCSSL
eukprot:1013138-Prymnesium_polylepis.1